MTTPKEEDAGMGPLSRLRHAIEAYDGGISANVAPILVAARAVAASAALRDFTRLRSALAA